MATPRSQNVVVFEEGLSILYEPVAGDASVDVIFVHGLQGHPQKTWSCTKQKATGGPSQPHSLLPSSLQWFAPKIRDKSTDESDDIFWPIDLLSLECPSARIMTWGYDSNVSHFFSGPANQTNLSGHAKNLLYDIDRKRDSGHKIIFVAHSLGGIIVKEVLRRSADEEEERLRDVATSTYAIIFLGTPHRGSGYASLGNIVQNIVATVGFDTNNKHIEALRFDGSELERSREEFTKQWRKANFQVRTFQESLGMKGVRGLNEKVYSELYRLEVGDLSIVQVVPDMSSSLDDPRERAQHINKNHMEMCKFSGFDDPGYQRVGGELKTFVKEIEEQLRKQSDEEARQLQEFATTKSFTQEETECLRSLYFPEIDARYQNIRQPSSRTCSWLLQHPDFQDWYSTGNGLLWLKGKAGSGKSSLVKRAVQEMETDEGKSNCIIAKYFFNARGVPLEKSYPGFLRSLVHQITSQSRLLLVELLSHYRKKRDMQGSKVNWHVEDLRIFLLSTVNVLGQPTYLLVDALDECEEHERQDVVSFLEQLNNLCRSSQLSISILFSSRHFPDIYIEECNEIQPEDWNNNDISEYVEQKLSKISAKQGVMEMQQEIVRKSQGVFLWVVLVVDILIKNRHETIAEKRRKLQLVPSELDQLFTSILEGFDTEELKKTAKFMQWVLFAERPLSPKQLFTAIAFDTEHPYTSFKAWRTSDEFSEDKDQLEALVRTRSRGLAEVKRSQSFKEYSSMSEEEQHMIGDDIPALIIVQFIHESVRTFFLYGNETVRGLLYPSMGENFVGHSHTQLARACVNFLSIKEIILWASQIVVKSTSSQDNTVEKLFAYKDALDRLSWLNISSSFGSYAARFLFLHAQNGERNGVSQAYLVHMWRTQEDTFQAWATMYDELVMYGIKNQGPHANLLYTAAHYNLSSCVSVLLLNQPECDHLSSTYDDRYGKAFLEAAREGNVEIIKLLLDNGTDIETRDQFKETALHISVHASDLALAQLLLDRGADIEARDIYLYTPLHYARGEILRLLLDRGANIEAQGACKLTALHVAAVRSNMEVARLLLDRGANIEPRDECQDTPLHSAWDFEDWGVGGLLLDRGANIEAENERKRTVLHNMVISGNRQGVQSLLDRGASIEVQDVEGQTALDVAIMKERKTTDKYEHEQAWDIVCVLQEHSRRRTIITTSAEQRKPRRSARLKKN